MLERKVFLQLCLWVTAFLTAVLFVSRYFDIDLEGMPLTIAGVGAVQISNAAYRAFSPNAIGLRKFLIGASICLPMTGLVLLIEPMPYGSAGFWVVLSLLLAALSLLLPMHPHEESPHEREKEPTIEGNVLTFHSGKTYDLDQLAQVELGPSREGSGEVTLTFVDGTTLTVGPSHNAHAFAAKLNHHPGNGIAV